MTAPGAGFIHRFAPAAESGGRSRTLLLLHGTGGNEEDLLPLGRYLDPGAGLLSPRGKVLERGMPRFFRRLAEGVFDLEDLRGQTQDLARFVRAASEDYKFDPREVVAVGFSNGANIAASLLLQEPGVLSAAILFHPMVPFVPETLPDLVLTRVFIAAGRYDPMVPAENTEELAGLLQRAGAPVTVHWQPGGHQITEDEADAARSWLAQT